MNKSLRITIISVLILLFPLSTSHAQYCCCDIPAELEEIFDVGCITYYECSEVSQTICAEYSGTWYEQSRCNPATGTCEAYTAIVLSRFAAIAGYGKVNIKWSTETEIDNAGFNVYRAEQADGEYVKINSALIAAKGYTTQGATYEFTDTGLKNRKTYYYKLEDIDLNGTSTMHGPVIARPRLIFGFRN